MCVDFGGADSVLLPPAGGAFTIAEVAFSLHHDDFWERF
jgi:hypothetical protein